MAIYKVPYTVRVSGEFFIEAESPQSAVGLARYLGPTHIIDWENVCGVGGAALQTAEKATPEEIKHRHEMTARLRRPKVLG